MSDNKGERVAMCIGYSNGDGKIYDATDEFGCEIINLETGKNVVYGMEPVILRGTITSITTPHDPDTEDYEFLVKWDDGQEFSVTESQVV